MTWLVTSLNFSKLEMGLSILKFSKLKMGVSILKIGQLGLNSQNRK